jgi:2-polyprenyl-3-methyl-5-hydroxy-6-metoxy-1,4-benzoquinol methylase
MPEPTNRDAIAAWAAAADRVGDFGEEGDFTRQQLLNPAIFRLLGPVVGRTVLDAGCGQGYLCRLLARQGAVVTGVEPAEPWYRSAVAREQEERLGITYLQADLSACALAEGAYDAVVANMVLMDIPDYRAAARRCVAALRPGGRFVVSLVHPCFEAPSADWASGGCVAVTEYVREHIRQQAFAPLFHRPLSSYLNLLIEEGTVLREIVEPGLDPAWARHGPAYERNVHVPSVIVILAVKPESTP